MTTVSVINIIGLLIDSCRLKVSYNPNPGRDCPGDIFILIYWILGIRTPRISSKSHDKWQLVKKIARLPVENASAEQAR